MAAKTRNEAIFRLSGDKEMTDQKLMEFISKNDQLVNSRYQTLWDAYNNDYEILDMAAKPTWKPDVRVCVNFARYIVDTLEGFSMGIPVKVTSIDQAVADYVTHVREINDMEDTESELSTIVSIFGRGYHLAFVDEDGEIGSVYLDPMESFAVYNDSIKPKMRYFVRTYKDDEGIRHGSVSDETTVRYFTFGGSGITWDEEYPHGFDGVPVVEVIMNANRRGVFEDVMSLINEYNKALSEKANDVESFAEAYLVVLGAEVDQASLEFMRTNRIINIKGKSGKDVVAQFLQKPSGDDTQEHLLDRMERLIFTIAMVCNISDDNFATSSGIALKYKMLPMINLEAKKWRKFQAGMNQFWKLVCSNPVTPLKDDDWTKLQYTHMLNYPANVSEEAETAVKLKGVTSKKTQLSVLSIVDDVDSEMEQIAKEESDDSVNNTDTTDGDGNSTETVDAEVKNIKEE